MVEHLLLKADALHMLGELEDARVVCNKALEVGPDNDQSLKKHLDKAMKIGAFNFSNKELEIFPLLLVEIAKKVRNLDLSDNMIPIIPQTIGNLKMLKNLTMAKNKVKSIPEDLGKLSKLEKLNLSFNLIQSVPGSFQKLKNLKEINLSHNQLPNFPVSLISLRQLSIVDLSYNNIKTVPEEAGKLEATELILTCNQISVLATEISNCPRLKTLRLDENCLSLQSIPTSLLADSNVSLLTVEGNRFDVKRLKYCEGFDKYEERFAAVKRKLDYSGSYCVSDIQGRLVSSESGSVEHEGKEK